MRQLIEDPNSATWIAEEEAELIGFSIVEWPADPGESAAYIQTLEVHPAYRGRGIGARAARPRRRIRPSRPERTSSALHVDVENAAAIRLYESRGYARQGREEHYYARHRAAFVYAKPLA